MKMQDLKLQDKNRNNINKDYITMLFLLLFYKHATVWCTRMNDCLLKNDNAQ